MLLIKLGGDDRVLGFIASTGDRDLMTVETTRGAEQTISTAKYETTGRGGKGTGAAAALAALRESCGQRRRRRRRSRWRDDTARAEQLRG